MTLRAVRCLHTSDDGQRDVHRGALARRGFEADFAAVLVDDLAGVEKTPVAARHAAIGDPEARIEDRYQPPRATCRARCPGW